MSVQFFTYSVVNFLASGSGVGVRGFGDGGALELFFAFYLVCYFNLSRFLNNF